eukprot:CAMPEP_0206273006 /NCGR_PEP_ID=MMETSP0047_2-20121206/34346_1 /ASSEMBLY_ACC=CAM_ASM_000192 /TAXON_ID=195065 /ORGANISM="Chroomonas mesostigmatica_cf, Strain CCMP1168" /LENGTH=55 /DNA_ID=CAMNT_0053702035 /DNA_START=11 /DNA_END=175 /DNA_ORIENTATION=+
MAGFSSSPLAAIAQFTPHLSCTISTSFKDWMSPFATSGTVAACLTAAMASKSTGS